MYRISIPNTYRFHESFGLRNLFGAKNRIRDGMLEMYIDSMIFFPFGLRSVFGAKNRIREGRQKCVGI